MAYNACPLLPGLSGWELGCRIADNHAGPIV